MSIYKSDEAKFNSIMSGNALEKAQANLIYTKANHIAKYHAVLRAMNF